MKTKLKNKPLLINLTRVRLRGSTLAIGLFFAFAIVASTHGIQLTTSSSCHSTGAGYLVVYSATDRVVDGDTPYNPHSSYELYTVEGKFIKTIANHISPSDEVPERVMLPVGRYVVRARSDERSCTRTDVIVRSDQTTVVDLESSEKLRG